MSDMVYAVHTRACTYLLDEEGVCGWVLSPSGDRAEDRCIGAQFVACLDLREPGGLIGELRVGASGLFARREHGRYVLLKTSLIEQVEYRRAADLSVTMSLPDMGAVDPDESPATQPPPPSLDRGPDTQRLRTEPPPPAYVHPPPIEDPETGPVFPDYRATPPAIVASPELVDLEELSTFSSEVTLTIPLYRPDPDEAADPWGGYEAADHEWPADGRHRRG